MIPVAEIFGPTIQGEGPDIGLKTMFLRVVGCDFNCSWCDSKFAWKISEDTFKYEESELAEALVNKCVDNNCLSVILTGGNPCLYNFEDIINTLHKHNIKIGIETQGSILPNWLSLVIIGGFLTFSFIAVFLLQFFYFNTQIKNIDKK